MYHKPFKIPKYNVNRYPTAPLHSNLLSPPSLQHGYQTHPALSLPLNCLRYGLLLKT